MAKYLLSVHSVAGEPRAPMSDAEVQELVHGIGTLEAEMKAQGAWVFSGRLDEPDRAKVVRVTRGDRQLTDGPFAESKEQIGGFYIIEAGDDDEALEWAAKVTAAVGQPIELRPFVDATF